MKTWSAEDIFVRAISVAAVGVQGLIDLASGVERITRPPRMGHDVSEPTGLDYTRPLCPASCDCGECYHNPERTCHCFDGAEQLAELEAEEEVSEPHCRVHHPLHPDWLCTKPYGHQDRHGYAGCFWTESPLSDDELVGVRGILQERYEEPVKRTFLLGPLHERGDPRNCLCPTCVPHLHDNDFRAGNHTGAGAEPTSLAVSAAGTSGEAVSGSFPPEQPASPCTDLATWLEPAVWTGLEPHEPHLVYADEPDIIPGVYCCGGRYVDWQDWREHVGKPIAEHLAQALPDYPQHKSKGPQ